tara:strand:+ start:251 stop:505 length:255 start_codon:yes stop_codon:yes gene_type:complete
MESIDIEEVRGALSQLPEEIRKELLGEAPSIDKVGIKLELIKFTTEILKHNQACDWETNKIKPREITFDQIISDSQKLFDFLTE